MEQYTFYILKCVYLNILNPLTKYLNPLNLKRLSFWQKSETCFDGVRGSIRDIFKDGLLAMY